MTAWGSFNWATIFWLWTASSSPINVGSATLPSIGPQSFDCGQLTYDVAAFKSLIFLQLGHNLLIVDSVGPIAASIPFPPFNWATIFWLWTAQNGCENWPKTWFLQLGHNLLIVDSIWPCVKVSKTLHTFNWATIFWLWTAFRGSSSSHTSQYLQLGHNLLIVDSGEQVEDHIGYDWPSIGPQSFDCGQHYVKSLDFEFFSPFNWATIFWLWTASRKCCSFAWDTTLQLGHNLLIVDRFP